MSDGNNGNVVVYHSEAERAFDQWVTHGGGWVWLLVLAAVFLAARFVRGRQNVVKGKRL